jgi:hypothetical protein
MLLDGSNARNAFKLITISILVTSGFEIAKAQRAQCVAVARAYVAGLKASDARPKLLKLAGDVAFGSGSTL